MEPLKVTRTRRTLKVTRTRRTLKVTRTRRTLADRIKEYDEKIARSDAQTQKWRDERAALIAQHKAEVAERQAFLQHKAEIAERAAFLDQLEP